MTEEDEEKYLRDNGWCKINQTLWNHKDCNYDCSQEVAILLQEYRDKKKITLFCKLQCKFGYHDEDLIPVEIKPEILSRWREVMAIELPSYLSHMWKCKFCKKERINYK